MRRRMIQKVALKSHKIAYDKVNALILVEKLVKLGSGRANFKVTLLERPPQKSCPTSKKLYEDGCFCQKIVFQKSSKRVLRDSSEHTSEQIKQTVTAKSSCQSQQRNANQSKASKYVRKQSMSSQAKNFA